MQLFGREATVALSASYLLSSVLAGCLKAAKESRGLKAAIQESQGFEGNMPIVAGPLQSRRCHEQPVYDSDPAWIKMAS